MRKGRERRSDKPRLTWVAMGAIGAVLVGGTLHLPAAPVYGVDPTPLEVGDEPCVQRVSDDTGVAVSVLTETDENGDEIPIDCVVSFAADTTWEIPANVATVWALVVGGGGAGTEFGGGGAGEVYENTELDVFDPETPETLTIDIRVGRGGSSGAGDDSALGNVQVSGGQSGDETGRGGLSGSGEAGGEPSTEEDGVIAGGGGAGHSTGGTHAAMTLSEETISPSIDSYEEITPADDADTGSGDEATEDGSTEESNPGANDPADEQVESEETTDQTPTGDDGTDPTAGEPDAGQVEEQPAEDPTVDGGEPVEPTPSFLRAGSGGDGYSSDITGESVVFAGGGAGAFSLGTSERVFDAAAGRDGDGGGSDSWGGGGAAGQAGGDGIVIIRYAITDKNIQVLTWDVPTEFELSQDGVVLPTPVTTGDGGVTLAVLGAPASGCVIDTTEMVTEEGATNQHSLRFSELGECVVRVTADETATFQAATLDQTIQIVADRPVVESVTPDRGPLAGGTRVQVRGRNFVDATAVTFGDLPGTDLVIIDDETIEVTTPLRTGENFTRATVNVTVARGNRESVDDVPFVFHNGVYSLNNGRLRFGGNESRNDCYSGCSESSFDVVGSINSGGRLLQPFYRSGDTWYKLTYWVYPLNFAVGTGSGSNWTGSNVVEDPVLKDPTNPEVNFPIVSSTNFTETSTSGGVRVGYGTVIARGLATINGSDMIIQNTYELGATDSFVKITTRIENPGASALSNVHLWVGTQDDFVGGNDRPSKKKGNLVGGVFQQITNQADPASALLIESGAEGVLFYSTTEGTNTIHDGCCSFSNSYTKNPTTSPIQATNDGSYALYLPVGTLASGAATEIVWFYAAGATADLATVAEQVAAAAEPARPSVERGDTTATITWTAPNPGSGNTIVGYNYRYSTDGGQNWIFTSPDLPATPLSAVVTGLDNSLTYEYQVRAIVENSADPPVRQYGEWSAPSESSVLGVPFQPEISTSVGGDSQVTLTYSPPGLPAGQLSGFEYRIGDDGAWTALTGTGSPITSVISGLENGNQYSIQIRAFNEYGSSEPSEAVSVVTRPTFTTTEMTAITRGSSFSQNLVANTGITTWAISSGTLPENLSLNGTTGRISGTPTTSGPYDFTVTVTNAAGSVSQRFVGFVVPYWPDNAYRFAGAATTNLQQAISTADIVGLALGSGATVTVTGLPTGVEAVTTDESQPNTTPSIVFAGTPTTPGVYEVEITIRDSSNREITQTVTLVVTQAPPPPAQRERRPKPQQASVDMAPPAPPPLEVSVTPQQNTFVPIPPTVRGPVLVDGRTPAANPGNISIRRDDNSVPAQAQILGNTGVDIQTGTVNLGVRIQAGTGEVRALSNGAPEVVVERGAQARIQGDGFLPNSTAQVFLPLQGTNAIELARVQVDPTGRLSGDARFLTGPGQAPIPVGPQVLQIVSVDAEGRQVIVDMTVNVAQPPPAPELNRDTGDIPTLTPGQSFATVAGLPVEVRVDVNPDNGSTTVDGGDWMMEIGVDGESSQVVEGPDGSLQVELERDSLAQVSGSGFMPQTRVDIWLFSTPTLLGTVVTDDEGSFDGFVPIDSRNVATGQHTLQLQGVGTDGYVRSANLGVVVSDALADPEAPGVFAWWWWALGGGVLGLVVWFLFGRRQDSDDDELDDYDPSKRVYPWSVTENSPKRGSYRADLIGVSMVRHG